MRSDLTSWFDERFHDDELFGVWPDQKRAAARARLGAQYARALERCSKAWANSLTGALRRCGPGARCRSGACPQCMAAFNRAFRACAHSLANTAEYGVQMLTLVPSDPFVMAVSLEEIDVEKARRHLRSTLIASGLGHLPLLAGLDVSLNSDDASAVWSAHWCAFTIDRDHVALREWLKPAFPKSDRAVKPVWCKPVVHTPDRAFSYGFKSVFDERSGSNRRSDPLARMTIGHRHPRFIELMKFLSRVDLDRRVYAQGIRTNLTRT